MSNQASAIRAGALAGAASGVAAGLIDGLWSYRDLSQYLPDFGGKLRLLVHLALSYGLIAALLGAALGLLARLLATSAAPDALGSLIHGQGERAKPWLPLAVSALPIYTFACTLAYLAGYRSLLFRKHTGLIIASSIVIVIIAAGLTVGATLLMTPIVAGGLRRVRKAQPLSSGASLAIVGVLAIGCGLLSYLLWRGRMRGVPLASIRIALPALLSPILALLTIPRALARLDNGRERNLALPFVVVALPLLGIALGGAFLLAARGAPTLPSLRIAQAMSLALLGITLAVSISTFLARTVESVLAPVTSKHAPTIAVVAMLALATTVGAVLWWPTLVLLKLRPLVLATMIGIFWLTSRRGFKVLAARIPRWTALVVIPVVFAGIILSGQSEAVRKAQVLHSGLGQPLAHLYGKAGDWDGDGYSRWLGGGDCDDSDPSVHPGADEIPFDGIDNNCLRGDVTARSAAATHFADLPPALPPDFNVLLISIDTIRADHLGAYGYPRNTTPHIDALANDGTLFANGWAHAPSTRYSIPALLTGRFPLNVRYTPIPGQWPGISLDNTTIAEVLQGRGFYTGAILNYWYFDAFRRMNQGFNFYDNKNKKLHKPVRGEGPAETSGTSSKEQSDKALQFLDNNGSKRFFLWVHYYDPHFDYEKHPGTVEFGNSKIDAYDHEIAFTDHHIGRVIDDLKARGLYDKTVIVLTGDHGEGFGEHGVTMHGYHLYAAQTKVPLIIRVPGTEPSVAQMPASHVDVLPTLANLAGAPSTSEMLGRSLLGVITGKEDRDQDRYVFQQLSYENHNEYRGAVSRKCHILYNISPNTSWELYRVDKDPMETRDIIDNPGECKGARLALETWFDFSQVPDGAVEALLPSEPTLEHPISVQFGKGISLVQIEMPKTVKRGQSASMEFTWKARAKPPAGWKVFAHFEKSPGQTIESGRFTADHKPVRPFSWWKKGQYIRYGHAMDVPRSLPTGRYDLWLGLYKGSARMDVAASDLDIVDRRVKVATIEVLR